jgi:hypothetical protein
MKQTPSAPPLDDYCLKASLWSEVFGQPPAVAAPKTSTATTSKPGIIKRLRDLSAASGADRSFQAAIYLRRPQKVLLASSRLHSTRCAPSWRASESFRLIARTIEFEERGRREFEAGGALSQVFFNHVVKLGNAT